MESNDEDLVEREKLVNDGETEEEPNSQNVNNSHPKSPPPIPVSPVIIKKIKSESSNDETTHTTRSPNSASASCSIEQTTSEKGQTTARVTYVNERRLRNDESRFDFKLPPRKFLKENTNNVKGKSNSSVLSKNHNSDDRTIKHHSFISEEPDVKHMEQALLGLLDDFHSGKLKAFGSGNTMEQMNKIREQQESLAKLHFELATAEEESLENGSDLNSAAARAQENMMQLVQRLEMLSVSIEQLQTSHSDGL
ncbi:coiled-coil domain-containing protein 28A isoform X1 [Condylostylus longicornis]|uniref:coiled-coil domain-containing protein 28A isoform X1 n=1 Tax=Condylostylus longicornis TaxID=2530218 RepID=UPI00244DC544|nr:coiled-coil domain-containing protein 28A isoform X1 [Condylostylus longicornis]